MMRVTLLGTGTPNLDFHHPDRQQTALLIEVAAQLILVDAGRGVSSQMAKMGRHPKDLDFIFITHHHYDHISDLGECLLTGWHAGRNKPVTLYGPHGTRALVDALFDQVFARDIAFARFGNNDVHHIREWVNVVEIDAGLVHRGNDWHAVAARVNHGNSLGMAYADWPCLGFRFEAGDRVFAFSGDTVACEGLDDLAHGADCLIQCCYWADAELVSPAQIRSARHVIASSSQAGVIAARNQVKKLVLTHIRPKPEPMMRALLADVRREFAGEIILAQDLMTLEV